MKVGGFRRKSDEIPRNLPKIAISPTENQAGEGTPPNLAAEIPHKPKPAFRDTHYQRQKEPQVVTDTTSSGINYLATEVIDAVPMDFDNPVQVLAICEPTKRLHKWQFETLMMLAGYLTPGDYTTKTPITRADPFRLAMPAANSSGKDNFIIAGFAIWFALKGIQNYFVGTSSSFEQVKYQTEPHIRRFADRINAKFGKHFYSTQFHHIIRKWGAQIKLFATNDAGRAEGFHPYGEGQMTICANEAKSIDEEIFEALERCEGFSYWLEVSSPGKSSGHFFESARRAIAYPAPATLGKFYYRRVTAFDCPHIPASYIADKADRLGEDSALYRSSILAEFTDVESENIIKRQWVDECLAAEQRFVGDDIGIGLDLAGGGDENGCFVRKGNRVIHKFFFTQKNTEVTVKAINRELDPWRNSVYTFNADNGGIGQAIIDQLVKLGWKITRRNNQSPAFNKTEFLNLGAQMWYLVRRLIQRKEILIPAEVPKLIEQLTGRCTTGEATTQGRVALESKKDARAKGRPSPDRADAFVLCFFSYRPDKATYDPKAQKDAMKSYTMPELERFLRRGSLPDFTSPNSSSKRFPTLLKGKI